MGVVSGAHYAPNHCIDLLKAIANNNSPSRMVMFTSLWVLRHPEG